MCGEAGIHALAPWLAKATSEQHHEAARQCHQITSLGISVIPAWGYSEALCELDDPPPLLCVRGDPLLLKQRGMGVVGARRASASGLAWARDVVMASDAALVVSGGALGIDCEAHEAALDSGKKTVVFLGVAVDRVYPAGHRDLFARILRAGGALVSEHPPGETTFAYDHARRNRLIAALSHTLYVAEADAKSGTMGTAHFARNLGRPVRVPEPYAVVARAGLEQLLVDGHAHIFTLPSLQSCVTNAVGG